jgi:cytochrome c oxidase subunit 3
MAIKYVEYSHKLHEGIVWGQNFDPKRAHDSHPAAGHAPAAHAAAAPAPADGHAPAAPAAAPAPATPSAAAAPAAPGGPLKLEPSSVGLAGPGRGGLTQEALASPQSGDHGHAVDPYEKAKTMKDLHLFMSVYFALTGLHGIHVLAGIVVISLVLWQAIKGRYDSNYYTHVDLVGLYWHVVDLVWIFLFPLLYLIH